MNTLPKGISYEKARNRFRASLSLSSGERIVKRFKTQQEAVAWLTKASVELTSGDFIVPQRLTVGEWIIEYLQTYAKPKLRPRSYERLVQVAAKLEPIANIQLQSLSSLRVQKLYNGLTQSASSNRKVHVLLNAALDKAVAVDIIKKNPCKATNYPKEVHTKIEIFTAEEISLLLSSIKKSTYYADYYPFFRLAVVTGARLGELLGLRGKSVLKGRIVIENNLQQLSNGKLIDQPPKTAVGIRDITIDEGTEAIIRTKVTTPEAYVFPSNKGTAKSPSNMEKVWKAVLLEAGLPHKRFHSLRHTMATMLLAKGEPLLEVSHRLGHAKPTQTLTLYGHAIKGYDEKLAETVTQIYDL